MRLYVRSSLAQEDTDTYHTSRVAELILCKKVLVILLFALKIHPVRCASFQQSPSILSFIKPPGESSSAYSAAT